MEKILLIIFLLVLSLSAQSRFYSASIDSGGAKSNAFYVNRAYEMITVAVDTPFTASNIGFERYNTTLGKWTIVRVDTGIVEFNLDSLSVPVTISLRDNLYLNDSLKIVTRVNGIDSVQAQNVNLSYQVK